MFDFLNMTAYSGLLQIKLYIFDQVLVNIKIKEGDNSVQSLG